MWRPGGGNPCRRLRASSRPFPPSPPPDHAAGQSPPAAAAAGLFFIPLGGCWRGAAADGGASRWCGARRRGGGPWRRGSEGLVAARWAARGGSRSWLRWRPGLGSARSGGPAGAGDVRRLTGGRGSFCCCVQCGGWARGGRARWWCVLAARQSGLPCSGPWTAASGAGWLSRCVLLAAGAGWLRALGRWLGGLPLVASRRAAAGAMVRRHGGVSGGEFSGGMGGPDGHPSPVQGCTGLDASAPPPPFLGCVLFVGVLAMFEAGRLLASS